MSTGVANRLAAAHSSCRSVRLYAKLTVLAQARLRARNDASRAAGRVVKPVAETFAAFEGRQPGPPRLLASCARRGTVLAIQQPAHEPFWRGGRSLCKARARHYCLPCFPIIARYRPFHQSLRATPFGGAQQVRGNAGCLSAAFAPIRRHVVDCLARPALLLLPPPGSLKPIRAEARAG